MRQFERALFDLRRGLPVVVRGPSGDCLIAAAEQIDAATLAELSVETGRSPDLLLTDQRLGALGIDARDARLNLDAGASVVTIRALSMQADAALVRQDLVFDLSPEERAALRLLRASRLIPAALIAPVTDARRAAVAAAVADQSLLALAAEAMPTPEKRAAAALSRVAEADVPLEATATARFVIFREADGQREHVAVVIGNRSDWAAEVPVRLHSACLTGDLFGSLRCDCGAQLRAAVGAIAEAGGGVLLYLAQEGRDIGLANKMRAYALQDRGLDTVDADRTLGFAMDGRHYAAAAAMLAELDIRRVTLLTNNPAKVRGLEAGGIEVARRNGVFGSVTPHNIRYLRTKAERAGHRLESLFDAAGCDCPAG